MALVGTAPLARADAVEDVSPLPLCEAQEPSPFGDDARWGGIVLKAEAVSLGSVFLPGFNQANGNEIVSGENRL